MRFFFASVMGPSRIETVPASGWKMSSIRRIDGGLAGAVGAEQAEDLALLDGEGDIGDGLGGAKGLFEVRDFDSVHNQHILSAGGQSGCRWQISSSQGMAGGAESVSINVPQPIRSCI